MIAVQIILIAVRALLADADECSCRCNKQDVCKEQVALTTEIYNNTDEIQKWSRYYNFVRGLDRDWEYQVDHIMRQELEVEINKTVEGLKNASQREVSKQKEDMMARMESLENLMRALHEQADDLDWTMEMLSQEMNGIRTELHRNKHARDCGVDFDNGESNVGGNTSSVLVWPWMAAVYFSMTNNPIHVCGGSVIHRHFVLTSAWCAQLFGRSYVSVKLGLSDLKQGIHLQDHRVHSTHIHPEYKTESGNNNYGYDIALLELEEPIPFGPFVRPVCLPPPEIPQNDTLYKPQSTAKAVRLTKYLSSPQTKYPTVLNLTILPQEKCRREMKKKGEENFPSPELSFCAKRSSGGCPKWGSPLMQSRIGGHGTRTWTQVGVTSWCASTNHLISPRLDHLRAWVDDTIAASTKV